MRTLEEINEKLYKNMSRLHRYEVFMDGKKSAAVRKEIFEEYERDMELYREERKLQHMKSMFEVKSLTKALKPCGLFGLLRKRTAKRAIEELSALEEWYCERYELSRSVYETITPERTAPSEAEEEAEAAPEREEAEAVPTAVAEGTDEEAEEAEETEDDEVIIEDGDEAEEAEEEENEEEDEGEEDGEIR